MLETLFLDCGTTVVFTDATNDAKITGGVAASPKQFPWQVFIVDSARTFFCGGTIIGKQWIVTTAQCAYG